MIYSQFQAYKHIFTSPSSVEKEPKATRSGNARIHGMTQVTPASIAYVATQVSYLNAPGILTLSVRFVLHCLHPPFFPERTPSPIRRDFTVVYLIYSMTLMRHMRLTICLYGGIGTYPCFWLVWHSCLCISQPDFPQLFIGETASLQEQRSGEN